METAMELEKNRFVFLIRSDPNQHVSLIELFIRERNNQTVPISLDRLLERHSVGVFLQELDIMLELTSEQTFTLVGRKLRRRAGSTAIRPDSMSRSTSHSPPAPSFVEWSSVYSVHLAAVGRQGDDRRWV